MSIAPDRTPVSLDDKLVMVTGASAGIGAATARAYATAGSDLVLLARRDQLIHKIADQLASEFGVDVRTYAVDVRDRHAVEALAKEDVYEDVDILVNNAGLAKGVDPIHKADPEDWETMIDTNVLGLLMMTRQVVPHMVERAEGHVVNIGSVAGRWVYKGGAVYCATKHAVLAISEGLRMDLIGSGVRVTNIEPGLVETEFSIVRLGDTKKAERVYADTIPLVPEDIAETILWATTRPKHVNIQEMVVFPTDQTAVSQVHRHGQEER